MQLRDLAQYATTFTWYYLTAAVGAWLQVYLQLPLLFWNSLETRLEFILTLLKLYQKTSAQLPATEIRFVCQAGAASAVRVVEAVISMCVSGINILFSYGNIVTSNDRTTEGAGPVLNSFFQLLNLCFTGGWPGLNLRIGDLLFFALLSTSTLIILLF